MPKITKRVVDATKPPETGELWVWDNELRGFALRVQKSGAASYVIKYRTADKRQRKYKIASVGTITPDEARKEARAKLAAVAGGGDPAEDRHGLRDGLTVSDLCDLYLADAEHRIKASTLKMDRSRIETHVRPLIGKRVVVSLTPNDIAKMQADIIAGKTKKPRVGRGGVTTGGRGAASRALGMFATILEFARKRGLVKENVARGVDRPSDVKKRRFLSAEELNRLGDAMRAAEEESDQVIANAAIRFLLMTGCRRMEALALPRDWLDERAGCIRFDDTKSGAQIRPVGAAAFQALSPLPTHARWVFPAMRGDGHFIGVPKALSRVCAAAEIDGVSPHTLRHTFAATAAEMGYSELTIAGLLGHASRGITARYAHVPDHALVSAANDVAARVAAALDGETGQSAVIPFTERLQKR
ncbi:MAG: tyrosine-type recombinase/integrase [Pseudomonadota bacterium]